MGLSDRLDSAELTDFARQDMADHAARMADLARWLPLPPMPKPTRRQRIGAWARFVRRRLGAAWNGLRGVDPDWWD